MEEKNSKKEIIKVEAKPVTSKETGNLTNQKLGNVKVDKIGKLTLNIFVEPLKKRGLQYKKNIFLLITDILLGIIVLILLGSLLNIFVFSRYLKINLMELKVESIPANLINGQKAEFNINYTNKSKDALTDVVLIFKSPSILQNPEFDIKEYDTKTNTLKIGDFASKAHGQFKVSGLLLGNFNEKHEFLTVINYKDKYGQDKQEFFSNQFQLTDSIVKTSLTLPDKIIANSNFTTQLNLENKSELALNQFKIKMIWPEGFTFRDSDLGNPDFDQTWQLSELKQNQLTTYNFTGKISAKKPQQSNFGVEISALYNGTEYLLAQTLATAPLEQSKLELNFINSEKNNSLAPGDKTTYTLHYKNGENYSLKNVELGLNLTGDFAKLKQISTNQNDNPQLKEIASQAEGTIELTIEAKPEITYTSFQENGYQIEAIIFAAYDDPIEKSRIIIESEPFYTKIDSQLSLDAKCLFFTPLGDQIGVGSIPPKVGEYTSYWAIIHVTNTNNKIKNFKLLAKVPAGIEFTNIYNVTDGNQINFNENSRQLEWSVDTMAASTGIFNPAPEARIQLAITPKADMVGKSPIILTNISATATDTITNAFLSASGKDLSIAIFPDQSLNKVIE